MHILTRPFSFACLLVSPWLAVAQPGTKPTKLPMNPYAADWKRADSLMARGLPQSALVVAERIYAEAKRTKNDPQLLKAALRRVVYRTNAATDEDTYLTLIRGLAADVTATTGPTRAVLQTVLAEVYGQYFRQNRYKFYDRTAVAAPANAPADTTTDPRTWDARRLQTTIATRYLASVSEAAALQKTPVEAYDAVVSLGNDAGRALRPTLFDVLAHRAIDYFTNTKNDVTKPTEAFEVNKPVYLAGSADFVATSLPASDPLSGTYQALRLYQQLLVFHEKDADPLAFAVNDVARLSLVYQRSTLANKTDLLEQTLTKQIATYSTKKEVLTAAEAEYRLRLVQLLAYFDTRPPRRGRYTDSDENAPADTTRRLDRHRAAALARDLIARFPNTVPGQAARPLLDDLLRTSVTVDVEEATAPATPFRARVTFQNVKTVYYKILKITPDEVRKFVQFDDYQNDPRRDKWFAALQNRPLVAQEQVSLPDDGDLHRHSVEIPVKGLPLGHYLLLASSEGKWAKPSAETDEVVGVGTFTVTNLADVQAGNPYARGAKNLYITHRLTGQPLPGATAKLVVLNNGRNDGNAGGNAGATYQANAQGKITILPEQMPRNGSYFLRISQGNDSFDTEQFYNYQQGQPSADAGPTRRVAVFTDRAIYRPGQLVYWKVLVYEGIENQFRVVPGAKKTIRLTDVNGEEVAKTEVITNDFGTATGTFTAPVGRLTGQMSIGTDEGNATIRVEEYKRPTFSVVAQPLKQGVVLGQTVTVLATAKTLAGAVIDRATVAYRVTRTHYQTYWGGGDWWRPYRPHQPDEIANGTATTNADGVVSVTFVAVPDAAIAAAEKPQFTFVITLDVTDAAGETRSTTQTLQIGYTALAAELALPSPVLTTDSKPYAVRLLNAGGEAVGLREGTVSIARLVPPRTGLRSRLWAKPDRAVLSREAYVAQFPLDLFADEDNPATWAKTTVRTQPANAVNLAGLAPDLYAADITATDSTGRTAQETVFFEVTDPQRPTPPVRSGTFVQPQKLVAQPGEEAVFWVGSALASATRPEKILMAVEEKGVVVREEWLTVSGQPLRVALPVQEKHRGNFQVHFALVQNGRLLTTDYTVAVPFTNKQLTVETETFRDRLAPGQAEQWTLRIGGPNQELVLAELMATLYDASLDAFLPLSWRTAFYGPTSSQSVYWQSGAFGVLTTQVFWSKPPPAYDFQVRLWPALTWGPYVYNGGSGRFYVNPDFLRVTARRTGDVLTGRVVFHSTNDGFMGVSVALNGTKRATKTTADGSFRLTVPRNVANAVLRFSAPGYFLIDLFVGTTPATGELRPENTGYMDGEGGLRRRGDYAAAPTARSMAKASADGMVLSEQVVSAAFSSETAPGVAVAPQAVGKAVTPPLIRKNFNETAFFFPQLLTDKQGRVVLTFTMPEALTRWRLLAFAHTKTMQTGTLEREIVTQKDLMVTTNVPRFLREGDTLRLTARIDNLTAKPLTGTTTLLLTDALTGDVLDTRMGLLRATQTFSAPAGQSGLGTWTIVIPQNTPPVAIRVTAQAGESTLGTFTDGEERVVPVLPNRMLVTDTQPFWINGGDAARTFRLAPLADRAPNQPFNTERLTVEITGNPAWYALQSLPYLQEYTYDYAEALFGKLYANALGAHILNSRPAFRQVVERWKQTPPKSPLAKNDELKAVVLENTPWLAEAISETERTAKLGQFFDQNTLAEQQRRAVEKLRQLQDGSGGLAWFSGMRPNLTMTLHVLAGLGHLRKLGVAFAPGLAADVHALETGLIRFADAEAKREMADEKRRAAAQKLAPVLPYWAAQYLYARSFFVATNPLEQSAQTYLLPALSRSWQQQSLQGQALTATMLFRYKLVNEARAVLQSLTERSRISDEMGMYWPDNQSGTYWYQAPVETQAYLIEAYEEAGAGADVFAWYTKQATYKTAGSQAFIDKMRQWLVQQKRTQAWPSTKATTEAIYALLLRGTDWLVTGATATVRVGGKDVTARATETEALTGYQKITYAPAEVTPALGTLVVSKPAKTGPAWGAMYWQHFEPMDAVAGGSSGLGLQKTITRQRNTNSGPVLEPITAQTRLKSGDLLTIRLVMTTDRAMQYLHLKDGRAAGFEPVTALSGVKYQNGMAYYEAPRDASTDFFIESLAPGTYVFEYGLRVVHGGTFGVGPATVQSFYAPEFAARSNGVRVWVE